MPNKEMHDDLMRSLIGLVVTSGQDYQDDWMFDPQLSAIACRDLLLFITKNPTMGVAYSSSMLPF